VVLWQDTDVSEYLAASIPGWISEDFTASSPGWISEDFTASTPGRISEDSAASIPGWISEDLAASTLKMEAAESSETIVSYHNTTWVYNRKDLDLNCINCNVKSITELQNSSGKRCFLPQ
jgi:hypothetical protein